MQDDREQTDSFAQAAASLSETGSDFVLVPGNVKNAMRDVMATVRDMRMVPFEKLHPIPGFNKRDMSPTYEAHLRWLTESMVEHGFKNECPIPVIIQKEADGDVIYYVGGHSRMIAVSRARELGRNIDFIPVIVKPRGTNKIDLYADQVIENTANPNTLRELGEIYYALQSEGLSTKDIAKKMRKSEQHVVDALDVRALPEEIKRMIIAEEVRAYPALTLFRQKGLEAIRILSGSLAEAKAKGQKKVTAKAFSGPRLPPRVTASMAGAIESLFAGLDPETKAVLAPAPVDQEPQSAVTSEDDPLQDPMVTIPASLLRELVSVHQEMENARQAIAKREEKARKKAEKAGAENDI